MLQEINAFVAQSGGPTAVINASLAGVLKAALQSDKICKVYGSLNGIQGMLENKIIRLDNMFKEQEENIEVLKYTPSMFLGTCRYKLPDEKGAEVFRYVLEQLNKYQIRYFFYIGGNDSMDTVLKLSAYAKDNEYPISFIGIPKTIDNDLMGIDHTPGFGSAAKFIASSILEISYDAFSYDSQSATIIEVMGRNAGWLAAAASLARNERNTSPHLIYLPERAFSNESFIKDMQKQLKSYKQVIVVVSEGIKDANGKYICACTSEIDRFGHVKLCGAGKHLERLTSDVFGCKARSVELNVLQRCAAHMISETDMNEAYLLGCKSVEAAERGETGVMVTLSRVSDEPYKVELGTIPIEAVASKEKKVPSSWINEEGNDITVDMFRYLEPLVMGEIRPQYKNGLPNYLTFKQMLDR